MNALLKINSYNTDLSRVQISLENIGSESDSGFRIAFRNLTNGAVKILNTDGDLLGNFIFVLPGTDKLSAVLDLSDSLSYDSVVIVALIEARDKDQYKTIAIAETNIEVPRDNASSPYQVTLDSNFVQYGEPVKIFVKGNTNKAWLKINGKTFLVNLDGSGQGSITINSSIFARESNFPQHVRIYISGEDLKEYLSNSVIQVLPESVGALATTSDSLLETNLEVLNPTEVSNLQYPSKGVGEAESLTAVKLSNIGDVSVTSGSGSFARVNSYSACKVAPNAGLVAVASQDQNQLAAVNVTDTVQLSRIRASRVYCLLTPLGNRYSDGPRSARVEDAHATVSDCSDRLLEISVDEDIWGDTSLNKIWIMDGPLQNRRFKILSKHRTTHYVWWVIPDDDLEVNVNLHDCFSFVPYGNTNSLNYTIISTLSPLPYIEVNGLAVSAVNPQIATNEHQSASVTNKFVYVVSEANVDGLAQLFFFSFNLGNGDIYGWKQLTWDGENKNAKIQVDKQNNLHIVWESSRCSAGQIMYGVLGPDSRSVMNETFAAMLDKQASMRVTKLVAPTTSTDLDTPLVTIGTPGALNLRALDEYGAPTGDMWHVFNNGGTVTIVDDGTVTVSGNPKTNKFAAFASLTRDETERLLDTSFSQLSYQVSFTLGFSSASITANYTPDEIADLYKTWKNSFTPLRNDRPDINIYNGSNSNRYTLGKPTYIYDKIVPIVGSFENPSIDGTLLEQLRLRHFMLAIVPERVRFLATNVETTDTYVARGNTLGNYSASQQVEYYTGYFKLALITETSANLSDVRSGEQHYHVVRLFGELLDINTTHSYKLAVHYSKLRQTTVETRAYSLLDVPEENVRFSGDLIVVVDDKVQGSDSFVPDFSDGYSAFDIGLGCSLVGEYRPFNIRPNDGTLNANLSVTLSYTNIAIGPHSVLPSSTLTSFAKGDRNVSRMYVASATDQTESMEIWQEIYGLGATQSQIVQYNEDLGLHVQKIRLSQVPITFLGRNASPSLCLDKNGRAHVSHQSNRDGRWEIYYTSSTDMGLPFRFDTRITDSDSDSLMPSVAVDNAGHRLITWHDNRSGVFHIYTARSLKTIPDDGACIRGALKDEYGLIDYSYGVEYNEYEYEYVEDFGSVCQLRFTFTNTTGATYHFHFIASFYFDGAHSSIAKVIDSRYANSNWSLEINGQKTPFPYNGISLNNGDTVNVFYDISKEDGLSDSIYYVMLTYDNGSSIVDFRTVEFFCPTGELPLCNVPVLYENMTGSPQNMHFRVTVYSDAGMTKTVLSADTTLDTRKWRIGSFEAFPSTGLVVSAGDTVSLSYQPEILSLELSRWQNAQTMETLLCNTKYYVKVESNLSSVYTEIDTFAFECSCDDVKANIWREDRVSQDWICSGQGNSDIRLTLGDQPALYPSCSGGFDGTFYIAWEDLREAEMGTHNPNIYFTAWDANTDRFYSRSQGYFDQVVAQGSYFKPLTLVNNLQHVAVLYTDGTGIFRRTFSLYQSPVVPPATTQNVLDQYLFSPDVLGLIDSDFNNCIGFDVYADDVARLYHQDTDKPIALIESCRVRFDVRCPHGAYAIRLKNEDNDEFSDWIPILPKLYSSSSSSGGAEPLGDFLQAYALSDSRFIVDWVLSAGNGTKTISCEIMTFFGKTAVLTRNVIARYKPLSYSVAFFTSGTSIAASKFNGYPVVSTKALQVIDGQVSSILSTATDTDTITIQVTFDDPEYLNELLSLNQVDRFGDGSIPPLTFDVVMQGKTLRNLVLTKVANPVITFDYDNPPTVASSVGLAVYQGSFPIVKADGFDNIDGQAAIIVNVPSPCTLPFEEVAPCDNLRLTPEDVRAQIATDVAAVPVTLERFRYAYKPDILCSFVSTSCVNTTEPADDTTIYDDDATFLPIHAGPVTCSPVDWVSPKKSEPCFFFRDSLNAPNWFFESSEFEFDFSDTRIDYLKFGLDSVLDDVLIMVKPNETISFTPALGSACPDPNSSSSSADGTYGRGVTFTLPSGSIIFSHTVNPGINYYCHGPSECNFGSAQKIFKVSTTTICTIPEGSYLNDTTDSTATWSIPIALGKLYNPASPPDQTHITNCLLANLIDGVATAELRARGFIASNGVLRFKLIHIYSGIGFATINNMTCGATCEE